jgi:hypothetical protein
VSARERAKVLVEKIVAEYVALETRAENAEHALAESKEREQALRRKFAEVADSGANKALRARVVELEAELVEARRQLAAVHAGVENVWRWQGDGADRPESLACPVVMTADTLRGLAARAEHAEQTLDTVRMDTSRLLGAIAMGDCTTVDDGLRVLERMSSMMEVDQNTIDMLRADVGKLTKELEVCRGAGHRMLAAARLMGERDEARAERDEAQADYSRLLVTYRELQGVGLSARHEALREAAGKAASVAREYEWKAQQVGNDSDGSWLSTCASVATRIEAAILALVEEHAYVAQLNDAVRRMLAAFDSEGGDLMGLSKEFYEAEAELRKAFGPPKEDT